MRDATTYDPGVSRESLPRPVGEVVHRELNGQTVLVHLGTNQIFALNSTGSRFWALLAEGYDRSTIRSTLLEEFDVSPAALDAEIDALVARLKDAALID